MESDGRRTIENELIFVLYNEENKKSKSEKDKNKKMVKQIQKKY